MQVYHLSAVSLKERSESGFKRNINYDVLWMLWKLMSFLRKQSVGVPLSGPIMKAQDVNTTMNCWTTLSSKPQMDLHRISQASIEGQARSCDNLSATHFPAELQKVMGDKKLPYDQVYNCDKTDLYFWLLPTKSLDFQNSKKKSLYLNRTRIELHLFLQPTNQAITNLNPAVLEKV
ncbi:hypothetical protein PR048_013863 [Dryococelus australis]|uniref:Uncharacterized protein n=1 Tax=Dryococelus australis TaxID=614101 RepID=A0ABQ9HTM0_9NEOP|nr:hypothetical protein PR048_013863 [Dryococelus australis]